MPNLCGLSYPKLKMENQERKKKRMNPYSKKVVGPQYTVGSYIAYRYKDGIVAYLTRKNWLIREKYEGEWMTGMDSKILSGTVKLYSIKEGDVSSSFDIVNGMISEQVVLDNTIYIDTPLYYDDEVKIFEI